MLARENFRRRHQRRLPPGFDDMRHGEHRDDGLAGADIALHQPQHALIGGEIGANFVERAFLRAGQLEGQVRLDRRRQPAVAPVLAPRQRGAFSRASGAAPIVARAIRRARDAGGRCSSARCRRALADDAAARRLSAKPRSLFAASTEGSCHSGRLGRRSSAPSIAFARSAAAAPRSGHARARPAAAWRGRPRRARDRDERSGGGRRKARAAPRPSASRRSAGCARSNRCWRGKTPARVAGVVLDQHLERPLGVSASGRRCSATRTLISTSVSSGASAIVGRVRRSTTLIGA